MSTSPLTLPILHSQQRPLTSISTIRTRLEHLARSPIPDSRPPFPLTHPSSHRHHMALRSVGVVVSLSLEGEKYVFVMYLKFSDITSSAGCSVWSRGPLVGARELGGAAGDHCASPAQLKILDSCIRAQRLCRFTTRHSAAQLLVSGGRLGAAPLSLTGPFLISLNLSPYPI